MQDVTLTREREMKLTDVSKPETVLFCNLKQSEYFVRCGWLYLKQNNYATRLTDAVSVEVSSTESVTPVEIVEILYKPKLVSECKA